MFWHSAAHLLGSALERYYGNRVSLCDGPSITEAEGGFFYEFILENDRGEAIDDKVLRSLEEIMKSIVKSKVTFERLKVSKDTALQMFSNTPTKLDIIRRIPAADTITLYRSGDFVDLCRGPHLPHSASIKAIELYRSGGSHVDIKHPTDTHTSRFQRRIYGIAFPTTEQLKSWRLHVEEAKKRDHRLIGKQQQLFFFHEYSPGSVFMLPHGTRIYNKVRQCAL